MKKILILVAILAFANQVATAQNERKFVNHTEIGGLFGRVKYNNPYDITQETVDNKLNLTLQTFNGLKIHPNLATGITLGMDWYAAAFLTPIAAGARWNIVQDGNTGFFGTLDAGYGFAWFHEDITGHKTKGGLMINPGFGLKWGRKSAFTMTLTYKRQAASVTKPPLISQTERFENRVYNRLSIRMGISF